MTNERCVWCNRSEAPLEALTIRQVDRLGGTAGAGSVLVHPEHAEALARYSDTVYRHARTFLLIVAGVLAAMIVFAFVLIWNLTWGLLGIGAATVVLGCVLFVWPFVTPETVTLIGARKGILIARWASVLIVAMGAWLLWLAASAEV